MSMIKFVAFTTAGCLVWNTILIYVGVYLGTNWTQVAGVSHYLIIGAIVAALVLVAVYLVWRQRKHSNAI